MVCVWGAQYKYHKENWSFWWRYQVNFLSKCYNHTGHDCSIPIISCTSHMTSWSVLSNILNLFGYTSGRASHHFCLKIIHSWDEPATKFCYLYFSLCQGYLITSELLLFEFDALIATYMIWVVTSSRLLIDTYQHLEGIIPTRLHDLTLQNTVNLFLCIYCYLVQHFCLPIQLYSFITVLKIVIIIKSVTLESAIA